MLLSTSNVIGFSKKFAQLKNNLKNFPALCEAINNILVI